MTDKILAPWRDGTPEGERSADFVSLVIAHVHEHAPESTQGIRKHGVGPYLFTVAVDSGFEIGGEKILQKMHNDYLFAALGDPETLDNIDRTAARVRKVADGIRAVAA
jgi:hypothetical protein